MLGESTTEDTDDHTADDLASFFKDKVESVPHVNTSIRRPIQVDADLGRVDACDC